MNSKTTNTGRDSCPHCAATSFGPNAAVPVPGDITICIQCAGALRFADDMKLVELSLPEMKHTLAPETVAKTIQAMKVIAGNRAPDLFNEAMNALRTEEGPTPEPEALTRKMEEIQQARGWRLPVVFELTKIKKPENAQT